MERKKRVKTTEYNLSLCSRDDGVLGRTHTTEEIHLSRCGLDVNVDQLLQTLDIRSFGAKRKPSWTRYGGSIIPTYSTISLTTRIRLLLSSLNLRSSP